MINPTGSFSQSSTRIAFGMAHGSSIRSTEAGTARRKPEDRRVVTEATRAEYQVWTLIKTTTTEEIRNRIHDGNPESRPQTAVSRKAGTARTESIGEMRFQMLQYRYMQKLAEPVATNGSSRNREAGNRDQHRPPHHHHHHRGQLADSRDIYIKLTDPTGKHKPVVNAHRVWDGARFIDSQHKQYEARRKAGGPESRHRGDAGRVSGRTLIKPPPLRNHAKPIHDNLKAVRIEDGETGDLLRFSTTPDKGSRTSSRRSSTRNKGGTITLKVTVRPSTAGALAVKPEVRVTLPKGAPAEALLWPTPDGNLVAEDPGKTSLNCGRFQNAPRELKTTTA